VAAAMEITSSKQADSSAQQDQAVAARGSEARTIQEQTSTPMTRAQNSGADTGEFSCVIGCCGFLFRLSSVH
jgi:hypothetical protein